MILQLVNISSVYTREKIFSQLSIFSHWEHQRWLRGRQTRQDHLIMRKVLCVCVWPHSSRWVTDRRIRVYTDPLNIGTCNQSHIVTWDSNTGPGQGWMRSFPCLHFLNLLIGFGWWSPPLKIQLPLNYDAHKYWSTQFVKLYNSTICRDLS